MAEHTLEKSYLVVGCKPWNRDVFDSTISHLPGKWSYVSNKNELDVHSIERIKPRYIFFLHWSWIVPDEIVNDYECICFHMTDLPYGRGGSPLQNLIIRGHEETKLTAFRMVQELDAGPVYLRETLPLEGSANDIYIRASQLSAKMIDKIIRDEPMPVEQKGEVVEFKRRRAAESIIPCVQSSEDLHNFIRMLDAEGYPRAYLVREGFKYEFANSRVVNGRVLADVIITSFDKESL